MTTIVFDIETDGKDPSVIWCIVAKEVSHGKATTFVGDEVLNFSSWLEEVMKCDTLVGHNILGYDIPVIKKLLGVDLNVYNIKDTLVMSRLDSPSRDGGHSLRAWGAYLEYPKDEFTEWSRYSQEMLDYCIKDVMVSEKVYQVLEKRNLNATALQLEHDTYRITSEQTKIGWEFDLRKATKLMAVIKKELYDVEDEVRSVFVPIKEFLPLTYLKIKFRKDGKKSKAYVNQLAKGAYENDVHGWGMNIYPEFNLGSRTQIAKHLQHYGWIPKEFTPTGKPIVNERVLRGIEIPQAQLINKYLMLQKRIGLISSWIEAVTIEGRIHGYVNSCGAVTGRMTHSKPNLAQVPSTHSEYGKECRELFKTKQGYKMVGVDASGLELRMLAHYLDDPEYTREILEGDIHTVNQKAAGLETRDQAKTFIYAFLYGAGEEKIGEIVGSGAKRGRSLKRAFLKNNPKLRDLRDSVKKAAKYGFIIGLDGRKVLIRSEHSALNALLQSAGAIVMKQALVYLVDYADNWNLTYNVVGNIHDEIQTEVLEIDAQKYGYLAVECIKKAGDTFNMKCPLDGEYKVGETWADTH